jgi:hypothetical protein
MQANRDSVDELSQSTREARLSALPVEERERQKDAKVVGRAQPVDAVEGEVFVYSGQRRNFTTQQQEAMRTRLAKDKSSLFTYSKEYFSQSVALVDPDRMALEAVAEGQARWKTKQGFMYPAPKSKRDFTASRVPNAPSAARVAELATPWDDPTDRVTDERGGHATAPTDKPPFRAEPKLGGVFGYVDGKGVPQEGFFDSVFLSGDGLAAEEAAAAAAEVAAWRSKVVVDDVHFRAHPSKQGAGNQIDKFKSMLDGPPKSRGIAIVHRAKLPSGKRAGAPNAAPVSMLSAEEYEDPVDFTTKLKPNDPAHFVGTDATGKKTTFVTTMHADRLRPKAQQVHSKRAHPPLTAEDMRDPRWGRA